MRCYPHPLERLLMEPGIQVLGNCGERKTFTLVMEIWINIVNILPDSEEIMKLLWEDGGTDQQAFNE